ncbi:MAG TPA: PAS domain-containing protein [Anaerolineae bacterium]
MSQRKKRQETMTRSNELKPLLKKSAKSFQLPRQKSNRHAQPPSPARGLTRSRFQALFKGLPLCAVVFQKTGDDFVITEYNQAAVTFTKGAAPKYVGKTAQELYGSRPDVLEGFSRAYEQQKTIQYATAFRLLTTGEQTILNMTFAYVPPDLVLLIIEDITDRAQAEGEIRNLNEELERRVEERTAELLSANLKLQEEIAERQQMEQELAWLASFPQLNPIPIIEVDLIGSIHFMNPTANRVLPDLYKRGGEHPWLADWESIGQTFRDRQQTSLQREVSVGEIWYLQSLSYVPASQRIRIYGVDITVRKHLEEQLRQRAEEIEKVMDLVPIAIWVGHDPLCQFITGNRTANQFYEAEEGENVSANVTPVRRFFQNGRELAPEELPMQYSAAHNVEVRDTEFEALLPSGKRRTLWGYAIPLHHADGQVRGSIGSFVDVTERKRAEEERERLLANLKISTAEAEYNRAQLEAVFQSVTDGIAVFDMNGNVIFVNEAQAQINGFENAEAMKRSLAFFGELYEINFPDGRPVPLEEWPVAKVLRGESIKNWELRGRRRDTGQEWFFSFSGEPVRHECGQQVLAVVITQDITERKQAEEHLVKLNRDLERRAIELEMANKELESFSYSISHDLRSPLSAINGFSTLLLEQYADPLPPDGLRFLELIRNNSIEMNQLVEGLLSFSRFIRQPIKKQPIDLAALARQVVEDLRNQQEGRRVEIFIAELPPAQADPVLLKQVFTNLLSNALKFTRRRDVAQIEIGSNISKEGEVVYFVRDNGVGFDNAQAEKLYGVFQRLHSQDEYEGTGVGLAIVERIVRRHGGRVCAEGEVNKGAIFYFTLA